jgi:hypothetical protein
LFVLQAGNIGGEDYPKLRYWLAVGSHTHGERRDWEGLSQAPALDPVSDPAKAGF